MKTQQGGGGQVSIFRWSPLLLAVVWLGAGCASTFKEVKPVTTSEPPRQRPAVLTVGKVSLSDARLSDAEKQTMLRAFHLGVESWVNKSRAFSTVKVGGQWPLPAGTMAMVGDISEVEKGSSAMRFWVGMGAGQARAQGEFQLLDNQGRELTKFKVRKSYLGGAGIGGWDMLKTEDLVKQLGELVAETTDKWLRGEKIN